MILVDTGPLVAAANRTDAHHAASVATLATAKPPRLVPGLVIAEVSYHLARDAGSSVETELRSRRTKVDQLPNGVGPKRRRKCIAWVWLRRNPFSNSTFVSEERLATLLHAPSYWKVACPSHYPAYKRSLLYAHIPQPRSMAEFLF
jgi:predicted nucleic acid-binding protein